MAIKKVRERVHNGGNTNTDADWDTIYYETSEDMIVGQRQLLAETGWRMHPGGEIEQWGTTEVWFSNSAHKTVNITLPIQFKTKAFGVNANEVDNSMTTQGMFICGGNSTLTTLTLNVTDIALSNTRNGRVRVFWRVKGV